MGVAAAFTQGGGVCNESISGGTAISHVHRPAGVVRDEHQGELLNAGSSAREGDCEITFFKDAKPSAPFDVWATVIRLPDKT